MSAGAATAANDDAAASDAKRRSSATPTTTTTATTATPAAKPTATTTAATPAYAAAAAEPVAAPETDAAAADEGRVVCRSVADPGRLALVRGCRAGAHGEVPAAAAAAGGFGLDPAGHLRHHLRDAGRLQQGAGAGGHAHHGNGPDHHGRRPTHPHHSAATDGGRGPRNDHRYTFTLTSLSLFSQRRHPFSRTMPIYTGHDFK